jgi:glycosyltransferase involved in cell wall biosynthesis
VMLAFKQFSAKRDDAVLVASWHSPFTQISAGFKGRLNAPLGVDGNGRLDVKRWARENGIDPGRVVDIGQVPNQQMPLILREMDTALQPSRCEGGTNFVAMEAMACGIPVILGNNTGVRDIIADGNAIPLKRQTPVSSPDGWGVEGWGESDIEEIVAALDALYDSTALRTQTGAAGARFMAGQTWQKHAAALHAAIAGVQAGRAMNLQAVEP